MIRIIKWSLCGVRVCEKWFKFFIQENVWITRKTKILQPEFMRDTSSLIDWRMEMYFIDIVNTYTKCFVLKFLGILYCLYYCRAYETVLGKSCKKLGVFSYYSTTAIAEDFYYSQCKIQGTVFLILTNNILSCFEKTN